MKKILFGAIQTDHLEVLTEMLEQTGYQVMHAANYSEVVSCIQHSEVDLLLIDSRLPGMVQFNLVERITGKEGQIPVIVVGSEDTDEAVAALEAGAHDYISNDREPREWVARIANLLRLFQTAPLEEEQTIHIDDLVIDPLGRSVFRDDKPIELTQREYDLLLFLARRQGQVCTREDILRHVWDYDFHTGTNVVDVYILHLREKIDKGYKQKLLRTIRGTGYKLMSQDDISHT